MANMAYCRFENTERDLRDCVRHLFDEDLSEDEKEARRRLIDLCQVVVAQLEDGWEEEIDE